MKFLANQTWYSRILSTAEELNWIFCAGTAMDSEFYVHVNSHHKAWMWMPVSVKTCRYRPGKIFSRRFPNVISFFQKADQKTGGSSNLITPHPLHLLTPLKVLFGNSSTINWKNHFTACIFLGTYCTKLCKVYHHTSLSFINLHMFLHLHWIRAFEHQ